ncbi:MAG TPA: outer membrane protein transport protein [Tenuifilaceae bacterium]|nr:outer membrane protein transport protein [Tenuifilaceae bacterium]
MKKSFLKITIATLLISLSSNLFSQSLADGLRYSQTLNGGTARFVSMGGAFGALGADFTSTSINPAGLGVYKSSEFTITPSFKHSSIKSSYNGLSASDSRNRLLFDNIGIVLSYSPYKSDENGIINFNIGFGYNRTNDFHSNSIAKGYYDNSSIIDYFHSKANSTGLNPDNLGFNSGTDIWDITMAYDTYLLIKYDDVNNEYIHSLFLGDSVDHENSISTKGGMGVYDISFSMNVSNKLYVGASIGIADYNFTYDAKYSEWAELNNQRDNNERFDKLYYAQFYETKGTGYNFKVGAIYNPIPSIRIGASIHTPTFYSMTDTYSSSISSEFDSSNVVIKKYSSKSPLGNYDYDFETPFKFIGSFAYIFQGKGLISIDVERVNYASMKFRNGGDGDNFSDLNMDAENTFRNVFNFRLGGEYRICDFALRGGYAFYPSPYKSGFINDKANISQYSGGVGYRSESFSIDMAYLHTVKKESYVFYSGANPVDTETKDGRFLITLGFRF